MKFTHTQAQQFSCVTYWTKTKGLHTLESEVGTWQWYGDREMGQHALRFNKEEVMRFPRYALLVVWGPALSHSGVITPERLRGVLAYVCSAVTNVTLGH